MYAKREDGGWTPLSTTANEFGQITRVADDTLSVNDTTVTGATISADSHTSYVVFDCPNTECIVLFAP